MKRRTSIADRLLLCLRSRLWLPCWGEGETARALELDEGTARDVLACIELDAAGEGGIEGVSRDGVPVVAASGRFAEVGGREMDDWCSTVMRSEGPLLSSLTTSTCPNSGFNPDIAVLTLAWSSKACPVSVPCCAVAPSL